MTTNNTLKAIHGAVKAGLGLAVCFGIATLFGGGCKQPNSSDPCNCPNGTVHAYGESCCNGDGCTCIKTIRHEINISGMPKIFIDDQTGGKFNRKEFMQSVLTDFKNGGVFSNFIARSVDATVFIVDYPVTGGGEKINGCKVRFNIDFVNHASDNDLGNQMMAVFSAMEGDTNVANLINSNSNIRLVNASPAITPRAQVAWEKGNAKVPGSAKVPGTILPNGRISA